MLVSKVWELGAHRCMVSIESFEINSRRLRRNAGGVGAACPELEGCGRPRPFAQWPRRQRLKHRKQGGSLGGNPRGRAESLRRHQGRRADAPRYQARTDQGCRWPERGLGVEPSAQAATACVRTRGRARRYAVKPTEQARALWRKEAVDLWRGEGCVSSL